MGALFVPIFFSLPDIITFITNFFTIYTFRLNGMVSLVLS